MSQSSDYPQTDSIEDVVECFPSLVDQSIVLTGPTAAGKSEVAVELAERIDGEILSLDSIAVYRGMDVGTAKPDLEQRQRTQHHLLDLVDPNEEFSVACYLREAHQTVSNLKAAGKAAIFVGGTPMFLKGVLRGFDPGPPADWEFRQSVEDDIERYGVDALRKRLQQVDPLAAHKIGPNDTRRMIRALEVARSTGRPISHQQTQFDRARKPEECAVFGLQWSRPVLHQRIDQRVQRMFAAGLVDEVRGLLSQFGTLSRTASQAVGYREVIQWIDEGEEDETSLIEEVSAHTRQLARRQETWFRSFQEIQSIAIDEPLNSTAIVEEILSRLNDK
ncbi:MAG: tRNA (adenosine(37)-N6)-dimethylallyltransferase MiaA [Planctomycetota bacterium]